MAKVTYIDPIATLSGKIVKRHQTTYMVRQAATSNPQMLENPCLLPLLANAVRRSRSPNSSIAPVSVLSARALPPVCRMLPRSLPTLRHSSRSVSTRLYASTSGTKSPTAWIDLATGYPFSCLPPPLCQIKAKICVNTHIFALNGVA